MQKRGCEMSEHSGGRIAANFRPGNLAEGFAVQMLRPFAAIAQVPREEDFGIDLIGTLIRKSGKVFVAEDAFAVQIKTRTAADFEVAGQGMDWFRELDLPYFPIVADLARAEISLYSINCHRLAFMPNSRVSKMIFTLGDKSLDDFPLGDPLLTWTLEDANHPDFSSWAYSVMKPAIRVEAWNQRFIRAQSIRWLDFKTQRFKERKSDGSAARPPAAGELLHIPPGDGAFILDTMTNMLEPFASWISNTGRHEHLGNELLTIRDSFRRLGVEPDPRNCWDAIASDMAEYAANAGAVSDALDSLPSNEGDA
jgi:hypothetical protein